MLIWLTCFPPLFGVVFFVYSDVVQAILALSNTCKTAVLPLPRALPQQPPFARAKMFGIADYLCEHLCTAFDSMDVRTPFDYIIGCKPKSSGYVSWGSLSKGFDAMNKQFDMVWPVCGPFDA